MVALAAQSESPFPKGNGFIYTDAIQTPVIETTISGSRKKSSEIPDKGVIHPLRERIGLLAHLDKVREAVFEERVLRNVTVRLSEILENDGRLEAGAYEDGARCAISRIRKGPHKNVCGNNGFSRGIRPNIFKRIWAKSGGIPIYQPGTILDIMPKPDGYLSPKLKKDVKHLELQKGSLAVTCSGTIGRVVYVSDTLAGLVFSDDLIRLECDSEADAAYLYAFLKTSTGQGMLLSSQYGMIKHITPEHLAKIPVPVIDPVIQHKIASLILSSYKLRDKSNLMLKAAETMLIEELDLPPMENLKGDGNQPIVFQSKFSRLADRFEPTFHNPLVSRITNAMERKAARLSYVGSSELSSEIILPGIFKRTYVNSDRGVVFLGGKQLGELDPADKKYLSICKHEERIKKELLIKEGYILVTCSGTIGNVAFAPKHWENWTVSQHVMRIVPANNDIAGYLYVFLASEYGKALIQSCSYGAVIKEINAAQLGGVAVPILENADVQKEINSLALKANRLRHCAYMLEQKALKIMDEEIRQRIM